MNTTEQAPDEAIEAAEPAIEPDVTDNNTIIETPVISQRTLAELPAGLRHNIEDALKASKAALEVQQPDVLRQFVEHSVTNWRASLGRDFVSNTELKEAHAHFAKEAERVSGEQLAAAEMKATAAAEAIERAITEAERPPSLLASLAPAGEPRARQLLTHAAVAQRIEAFVHSATSLQLKAFYQHLDGTGQAEAAGHLEALADAGLLPQRGASQEDIEASMWLTNVLTAKKAARVPSSLRAAAAVFAVTRQRLATWRSALASSKAGGTALYQ